MKYKTQIVIESKSEEKRRDGHNYNTIMEAVIEESCMLHTIYDNITYCTTYTVHTPQIMSPPQRIRVVKYCVSNQFYVSIVISLI